MERTWKTCGDFGGKRRDGKPCGNKAGMKTNHKGTGRCYRHGGCSMGRPLVHGRYAKGLRGKLAAKIVEHMNDPDPLDLRSELAVLRARISFLTEKLDKAPEKSDEDADNSTSAFSASAEILNVIYGIQKVIDTISKVQARKALTARESLYLLTSLADVIQTEIHYIRGVDISDEDAIRHILSKLKSRFALSQPFGGEALIEG